MMGGTEAGQTQKVAQPMAWERGYYLRRAEDGDESTLPVVREFLKRSGALEAYGDMSRIAQQRPEGYRFPTV